jgi:uncharacterized protein (DUF305 family)
MGRAVTIRGWVGLLGLLLVLAGCSQPDDSGVPPTTDRSSPNLDLTRELLSFHEHELALAQLVPRRAGSDTVRALGRRSRLAHEPQAHALRLWLHRWSAPSRTDTQSSAPPPGAASSEEMVELANATGAGFDRLFLALMTRHHQTVLFALQSVPEAAASTVPQGLIAEIRTWAQAELDELDMTLARSPE